MRLKYFKIISNTDASGAEPTRRLNSYNKFLSSCVKGALYLRVITRSLAKHRDMQCFESGHDGF